MMACHQKKIPPSAPVSLTGLFSGGDTNEDDVQDGTSGFCNEEEVVSINFAGIDVKVNQMAWHEVNANQVWPGAYTLAEHLLTCQEISDHSILKEDHHVLNHRYQSGSILELGAATGAMSVALKKSGNYIVFTSDFDDGGDIQRNIESNFARNGLQQAFEHIPHTWGTGWTSPPLGIKFMVASDILLYVKSYPALVRTIKEIFSLEDNLIEFLMSWNRRIAESEDFFQLMQNAGFAIHRYGRGLYSFFLPSKTDRYLDELVKTK